uniref:Uncharacterized protein n=2 Tax=Ixodes scapularis TaxID=6945 RepID=A0A1S4LEG4_IXOSC
GGSSPPGHGRASADPGETTSTPSSPPPPPPASEDSEASAALVEAATGPQDDVNMPTT